MGIRPLSYRQWQVELHRHEASGKVMDPSTRTHFSALALVAEAKGTPLVTTSPAWKQLLHSGTLVEDADMFRQLKRLRSLPAPHLTLWPHPLS